MHRLKAQRGQALVEFALILPLLLSIILGIFDFGTAFNYQNNMSQLANEAARYASVGSCAGCTTSPGSQIPDIVANDAATNALKNSVTIVMSFPSGSGCQGQPVKATVTKTYSWIPYLKLTDSTLTTSATMRMEYNYNASTTPFTTSPPPSGTC